MRYAQQPPNDTRTCCGDECFRTAHAVAAAVSAVVCMAPILLYIRSKDWYRRRHYEKLEEDESTGRAGRQNSSVQSEVEGVVLTDAME